MRADGRYQISLTLRTTGEQVTQRLQNILDVGDYLVDTHDPSRKPRHAMLINGHNVEFEVDTVLEKMFGRPLVLLDSLDHLSNSPPTANEKSAFRVSVLWTSNVVRQYYHPPPIVVSSGASLLGLNWIQAFQLYTNALLHTPNPSAELPSAEVHTLGVPTDLDPKKVIADHPSIFAPCLRLSM